MFNADDRKPLHRNTLARQFQRHVRAASVGKLRLRDLRHTYNSLLMGKDVPLKTISELMGPTSTEVTTNTYLHSLDV